MSPSPGRRTLASDPVARLDLSYRIRSKILFREALIHTTAQYFPDRTFANVTEHKPGWTQHQGRRQW